MSVPPFKVKAVFDYKSDEPDDLSFPTGQIITVTDDDDADWYTGEYDAASGEKLQGIFPRNFVEKYEPTVPTRPARAPKRVPASEPTEDVVDHPAPQPPPAQAASIIKPQEEKADSTSTSVEPAKEEPPSSPLSPAKAPAPAPVPKSPPAAAKPAGSKAPPPVAEKPSSSSFKDRIAAFNKPAAPPVSSYKPSGAGSNSNFVKKAFVAPPPSRNAYVPPPREPQPQKIYRREEDPQMQDQEPAEQKEDSSLSRAEPTEDEPKPQSLKDRIAALQKQQLEQASRNSEKKEKPKRPPKKRVDSADDVEHVPAPEPGLSKVGTNETTGPTPGDSIQDDAEPPPGPPIRRTSTAQSVTPQPQPSRELVSDTNDADDSGAGDEEDGQETSTEEERPKSKGVDRSNTGLARQKSLEPEQRDDAEEEDEEDEEEEDEDPEIRRRRELRERMAKMSGGMGMMGMFGPPGGMGPPPARKQKPSAESGRLSSENHQHADTEERAAPVRIMALPGMATAAIKRPDETNDESDQDETARPTPQETVAPGETNDYISQPLQRRSTDRAAPPTPHDRAAPPPPPRDTRAVPPPPPTASRPVPQAPQSPISRSAPPVPPTPVASYPEGENESEDDKEADIPSGPQSPFADGPTSPPLGAPPPPKRTDVPPPLDTTEKTIAPTEDKRASRPPPPVPQSPASPQTRAPPPPPPGQPPVRRSTSDSRGFAATKAPGEEESEEDEVTEYDGDYDTDIASSAKHKDALKAHNRDSSLEDGVLTDDALKSSKNAPTRAVPPLPPVAAPRDVPPPPPPSSAPKSRKSLDAPRAAPPPVPPPKLPENHDEDYDPYRYDPPPHSASRAQYSQMLQSPQEEVEEEDLYGPPSQAPSSHPPPPPPPAERSAPPPPNLQPDYYPPPPLPPSFAPPGQPDANKASLDVKRSATVSRRSMDQSRATGEQGYIARDIDLGKSSGWWAQHNLPPPSLQNRTDVLYQIETSSNSKRGGKSTISKDVYVLYIDYSSTTINASFDSADPSHVVFEQHHERPPPPPRRDQLETASSQFGSQIARAANSLAGSAVADGSGHAFVLELLRPHKTALLPIGTRAYGALVYANLGNASTQQFDEIRAGDIVTFRNAKFAGHKGGLHAKYSMDVGKPDHVAVVIDWDGTKKKIRAWEQGRQEEKGKKPKVREESFKVGDLKSGEVMVWRVMPRSWVGWDKLT